MTDLQIFITSFSAIILFLFGLENFSKEVQEVTGRNFRRILAKFTKNPVLGLILGAIITAIIQSSSATSVIAIGFVNAGVLTFKRSIPIILGANIGTTVTAQLIAFELTNFAPSIIIIGFLISVIKNKYSFIGKSIFYFGFVFFSLNLISSSVRPLQTDERLLTFLTSSQNIYITISIGAIFTALVQSSSVTTGIAVILTQSNFLSLTNAIPIIIGANIGTTITAILASLKMKTNAKRTAFAHVFFNIFGVIIFLPFIDILSNQFKELTPEITLANIHFLFNLSTSILFLILLNPFARFIEKMIGKKSILKYPNIDFPKVNDSFELENAKEFLDSSFLKVFIFLEDSYYLTIQSIEKKVSVNLDEIKMRSEYFDYLRSEFVSFFSSIINKFTGEKDTMPIIDYIDLYEYLYQLQDSLDDILRVRSHMDLMYIVLEKDMELHLKELSSRTLLIFNSLKKMIDSASFSETELREQFQFLQNDLSQLNRDVLSAMSIKNRIDAGSMLHLFTYSQRFKDKLSNLSRKIAYKIEKTKKSGE